MRKTLTTRLILVNLIGLMLLGAVAAINAEPTWNFSGPVSYGTVGSQRGMGVILLDGTGLQVTSFGLTGVTLNAGRVPVLADINNPSTVTARLNAVVEGCVAADADVSACNPVEIGGYASTAVPTAMSADTDQVRAWFSRNGVLHTMSTAGTATLTNIADTASSTALTAANTARLSVICFNDSTTDLFLNYGATASATAFTYKILAQGTWEMPTPIYTGVLNGIWSADASGSARCTELAQ